MSDYCGKRDYKLVLDLCDLPFSESRPAWRQVNSHCGATPAGQVASLAIGQGKNTLSGNPLAPELICLPAALACNGKEISRMSPRFQRPWSSMDRRTGRMMASPLPAANWNHCHSQVPIPVQREPRWENASSLACAATRQLVVQISWLPCLGFV